MQSRKKVNKVGHYTNQQKGDIIKSEINMLIPKRNSAPPPNSE